MRTLLLFFILINLVCAKAPAQTFKKQLCHHAWQQRRTSIVWSFKENGEFSAILFWSNKKNAGFTAKKGTYTLDDSAKIMVVNFDSTYTVYSKDSSAVSKDIGVQKWQISTFTDQRMVLRRSPVWEFEKKGLAKDDENVIVTLEASKKRNNPLTNDSIKNL